MPRTVSTTRAAREKKVRRTGDADPSEPGKSWNNEIASGTKLKAWRSNLAAQLYLTGTMTLLQISEYFLEEHGITISESQLSRDLNALKKQWQAQAIENTDTRIRAELAKLDNLELTSIQGLRDTGEIAEFCDVMLKIAKRRSDLLGLDKAKKLEIKHGIESLSDAELESIAADRGVDGTVLDQPSETED